MPSTPTRTQRTWWNMPWAKAPTSSPVRGPSQTCWRTSIPSTHSRRWPATCIMPAGDTSSRGNRTGPRSLRFTHGCLNILRIRKLISSCYSVALTDCGTGVTHNAMSGILRSANNLVIPAGYAVSCAKRACSTLQWQRNRGGDRGRGTGRAIPLDRAHILTKPSPCHRKGSCKRHCPPATAACLVPAGPTTCPPLTHHSWQCG